MVPSQVFAKSQGSGNLYFQNRFAVKEVACEGIYWRENLQI